MTERKTIKYLLAHNLFRSSINISGVKKVSSNILVSIQQLEALFLIDCWHSPWSFSCGGRKREDVLEGSEVGNKRRETIETEGHGAKTDVTHKGAGAAQESSSQFELLVSLHCFSVSSAKYSFFDV